MKTRKIGFQLFSLLMVVSLLAACAPKAAAPAAGGGGVASIPSDLVAACKSEGMLTIIATPGNWANYQEISIYSLPLLVSSSTHWMKMLAQLMNLKPLKPTRVTKVPRLLTLLTSVMPMVRLVLMQVIIKPTR